MKPPAVRPVPVADPLEAVALARRVGIAEESLKQAAKAVARPVQLLLTDLAPGAGRRLAAAAAGEAPEGRAQAAPDRAGVTVLTGDGDAALVSGTRWALFALAAKIGADDADPALAAAAGAIGRCLRRLDAPATGWRVGRDREVDLRRTQVMGIVNVTPDSFSDGGAYLDPEAAAVHGEALVAEGADLLDVGGESTRPGAPAVDAEEEIRRVVPVIEALARRTGVPLSVDTTKAAVAEAALNAGATVVNDVSGLDADPDLAAVVARHGAGLVLMHMRGTPRTMQTEVAYGDLVGEVIAGLEDALSRAEAAGVAPEQVAVDPGIGFAKTAGQSLYLLRQTGALLTLGRPILVGPSRKSFIGHVTGEPVERRLPGTLAAVVAAILGGARIVRVHDVAQTVQAVRVADAILDAREAGAAFAPGE
jgi:dihydropteroate synthase